MLCQVKLLYSTAKLNEKTQERYGIKEKIFAELVQNCQHPDVDENILLFQHHDSIKNWLKTCLNSD